MEAPDGGRQFFAAAELESSMHTPVMVVETDYGPRQMRKLFDIVPPSLGDNNVQSLCRFGDGWILLHHGSILQVYERGQLIREARVDGELFHPNDCVVVGAEILVCDGGEQPALKWLDPVSSRMREVLPIFTPGWRLASVSRESDGGFVTVSAEDIEPAHRDRVLVSRYAVDWTLVESFTVPVDSRYSQGCTVVGTCLYLNNNDGVTATSARFIRVDLSDHTRIGTFTIEDIGETEGLDTVWLDQDPFFVTALRDAVYLLAAA